MDTKSVIESILKIPHAKRIFVWEISAKNTATEAIEKLYVTNASKYVTSSVDSILPNKAFLSRLEDDFTVGFSAGESDKFSGFEGLVSGKIVINISDFPDSLKKFRDGTLDLYNQSAKCYFGSDIDPTTQDKRMEFDQFVIICEGKIQNSVVTDGNLVINLDDMSVFFGDALSSDYYRSFGKGIEFTNTTYGFTYKDARHAVEGKEFTLGVYFSVQTAHTSTEPLPIIARGIFSKCNYGVFLTNENRIGVKSGTQTYYSKKNAIELGKVYCLIAIKKNKALRLYLNGEFILFGALLSDKNYAELEHIYVNRNQLGEYGNIRLFEFVVYNTALTEIEVSQFSEGPFPNSDLDIGTEIQAIRRIHYKFEDYGTLTGLEPYIVNEVGNGMDLYMYRSDFPVISNNSFEFNPEDTVGNGYISDGNNISAWTASNSTKIGRLRLNETSIYNNGYNEFGETVLFINDANYLEQSIYIPAGNYKFYVYVNATDNGNTPRVRVELNNGIGILIATPIINVDSAGTFTTAFTEVVSSQFNIPTSGNYTLKLSQSQSGASNFLLVDKIILDSSPTGFTNPNIISINGKEGDDPEVFSQGLVGKVKPLIYGNPQNLPILWMDTLDQISQIAKTGEIALIKEGRINGVPMVQDLLIPVDEVKMYSFDNSIRLNGYVKEQVKQIVQQQDSPARPGQQILIPDSVLNPFAYTVTKVVDDKIFILEALDQETITNTTITSVDYKYSFEPTEDILLMENIGPNIEGQLTFDVKGEKQYKVSEIIKNILDLYFIKDKNQQEFIIDNQLLFDPYLSIFADEEPKSTILKMCLDSCFGYMYKLSNGKIRLGTYQMPSETPNFTIRETLIDDVYINELDTINPYWQIQIGYSKNYTVQTEDKLSPLVTIPNKRKYSKPYIYHVASNRAIFLKYADSGLLKVDTYLDTKSDAARLANVIYSVFQNKLSFYQINSIRNFGKIIEPGQTMRVYSKTFFSTEDYKDIFIKKAIFNYNTDSWQVMGYALGA